MQLENVFKLFVVFAKVASSLHICLLYVDDLIKKLRSSSYGLHIGSLFVDCILYADDIVLLSCTIMFWSLKTS